MSIDGHPIVPEFISDEANEPVVSKSEKWKVIHVIKSNQINIFPKKTLQGLQI